MEPDFDSPTWKWVTAQLCLHIEQVRNSLESAPIEKVADLQSRLRTLRDIARFPDSHRKSKAIQQER